MSQSQQADNSASLDQFRSELVDRIDLGMPHTIDRLANLVRIPSVSWDAFDREQVQRSAEFVREQLVQTRLFDEVEIHQYEDAAGRPGQPGVIAHRAPAPGAPTVLLYAHHDVQPPGDERKWDSPVYEPTIRGERLYGRGASDDKAGVMLHIAALEALRDICEAHQQQLPIGISVFIEGEEENGSRSFGRFLDEHRDALGSDYIIVADSDNPSTETPGLTVALRGNVTFALTVRSLTGAWHSGMFGGVAPDAMLVLTRLLNSLWDENGSVAVPGLHSHSAPVPEYDEQQLANEIGAIGGQLIGVGPVRERTWYQPAITITGIDAPSVAESSNTLLPEVRVRVSARIAPGQPAGEAAGALMDYLRAQVPWGAELEFDDLDVGEPFLVDTEAAGVAQMCSGMRDAWGVEPELTAIGGSIPFIAELVERFPDAQILVTGVEDPETRAHSPNESQHLGVLRKAIKAEALFLAGLVLGSDAAQQAE